MNLTFLNDRSHGLYKHRQELTKILDDLRDIIGKYIMSLFFSPAGGGTSLVHNIYKVGDNIPRRGIPLSRVIKSPSKFSIQISAVRLVT